jgi:hypothetical protein
MTNLGNPIPLGRRHAGGKRPPCLLYSGPRYAVRHLRLSEKASADGRSIVNFTLPKPVELSICLEQGLQSFDLWEKWSQDGDHWHPIALKVVNSFTDHFPPANISFFLKDRVAKQSYQFITPPCWFLFKSMLKYEISVHSKARSREKIWPASLKFFRRWNKFQPAILIHWLNCQNGDVWYESYCKNQCFHDCIFIIFKLVYFTTVNLDLHFKYERISQLNDLVYYIWSSCGKQMKWNISIEFHLPFFFTWQFKFVFASCHF